MVTGQHSRPWVIAGALSLACYELVGIAFALSAGRLQLSGQTVAVAAMFVVMMGLLGLLIGLVFAKFRRLFGSLNTYAQGVVAMVFLGVVLGILTKGVVWFSTVDFVVSTATSAGAGLLFVYLGLRFGASR
jgi:hypothetical protein